MKFFCSYFLAREHKRSSLQSIDLRADNCPHFSCWHTEILLVLLAWHKLDLLWTRKKKSIFLYKTFTWDRIQKPSISAALVKMKDFSTRHPLYFL